VPARTFEDSTGVVWEVFEVHRSSAKPGAVSSGLEAGWLAFVSGDQKRRLAPYPREWESAAAAELERLCGLARVAVNVRLPGDPERRRTPRPAPFQPPAPSTDPIEQVEAAGVEDMVRAFAKRARATGLPAIEAMVRLKQLLADRFPDPDSEARDLRRVRRWFVESYYFERPT
jgi:hypothetical protein